MKYSLKWEIEMSLEYQEMLLNLMAQGYFSKLYKGIMNIEIEGIKIFSKEIHDIQFQFIADNIEVIRELK